MNKAMVLVFFAVLFPVAVYAEQKTLYDISENTLFLVEAYTACADRENVCTREEAHAIKAGMENCFRDFVLLVKSGSRSQLMLTPDQAKALSLRARAVRDQLSHSENANEVCNASIYFFSNFIGNLQYVAEFINPILIPILIGFLGPVQFILSFIYYVSLTAWYLLLTIVLSPTCFFWWL